MGPLSPSSLPPPTSPLLRLPLFPDCTPTCPGPASGEIGLAGGLFSELCSFSFLLPFLFSPLFPPVFFPCLYRCWLITITFSLCQQCAAAAAVGCYPLPTLSQRPPPLPPTPPPPLLSPHPPPPRLVFLSPSSLGVSGGRGAEEEGQSTDVY